MAEFSVSGPILITTHSSSVPTSIVLGMPFFTKGDTTPQNCNHIWEFCAQECKILNNYTCNHCHSIWDDISTILLSILNFVHTFSMRISMTYWSMAPIAPPSGTKYFWNVIFSNFTCRWCYKIYRIAAGEAAGSSCSRSSSWQKLSINCRLLAHVCLDIGVFFTHHHPVNQ